MCAVTLGLNWQTELPKTSPKIIPIIKTYSLLLLKKFVVKIFNIFEIKDEFIGKI